MKEISYQQIAENQKRVVDYKQQIERIIGYIDDDGCRKIKPEHFLSGEIAAYKFLISWEKRMKQGEQVITNKVIEILDTVENLIYWSSEGKFEEKDTVDSYESLNTEIWIELLEDKDNAPSFQLNNLILIFAAANLASKGVPDEMNDYLNYSYDDMLDGLALGEAYSMAHEWLLSLPRNMLLYLMNNTELYRFHFNLLN